MPRSPATANFFTFVGGLNTESGPLTFKENTSLDEENFDLLRDGSRKRRLGADYEDGFAHSPNFDLSQISDRTVSSYVWKAVAGQGNIEFLVVQIGDTLNFHDQTAQNGQSVSANKKSFTVSLVGFLAPSSPTDAGEEPLQFSTGRGRLFVTSSNLEPFYVEYDPDLDTISTTEISIEVRDLTGVLEAGAVNNRPGVLTDDHNYNLKNQGWDTTRINETFSSLAVYPSNADIWFVAKNNNGVAADPDAYDPEELVEQHFGTTPAAKGSFIYDFFLDDRDTVSGVSITTSPTLTRPSSVTFFSGRVFYSHGSRVFFSQTILDISQVGKCYQDADPTSEHIFDLIATDGGEVSIPEAGNIIALISTKDYVLACASNGIWQIKGIDGKFSATDFQINKVTDIGIESPKNVVPVEGLPVIFSNSGIYQMQDDGTGVLSTQNLTENSIQEFYLGILPAARRNAEATFDPSSRKLYWFYNSDPLFDGVTFVDKYDSVLILDVSLPAFYKYSVSELTEDGPFVYSSFITSDIQFADGEETVVDDSNVTVTDEALEVVVRDIVTASTEVSSLGLITVTVDTGASYKYTISGFNDGTYVDWRTEDGTGVGYDSFMETGYFIGGDAIRNKQATYIYTYMQRTEQNIIDNGSGGAAFDVPSSCKMQAKWEWTSSAAPNRWSPTQQIYRLRAPSILPPIGQPFDYGFDVITAKSKIRGKGKSIHIRFESEAGKECHLLGWAMPMTIERGQ